jgi:hypothetical protein
MVMVLPFYLPSEHYRPDFGKWLIGRGLIAIFAILIGALLATTYGTVLPDSLRFLPLAFLIMAAMVSSCIQFYALMRLRPAN